MKRTTSILLALTALFVIVPHAKAELSSTWTGGGSGVSGTPTGIDPTFFFSISLGGNVANATLMASDLGGGQFLATSGVLNVTAGPDVGTYALVPGGPAAFGSPSGVFIVDNVLFPGSNPVLDIFGLLFSGSGLEINIWGNSPDNYSFFSFDGSNINVGVTGTPDSLSLSAVPEPSSLVLACVGGIMVGGWSVNTRWRKRLVPA
jgi:hypothetical protein